MHSRELLRLYDKVYPNGNRNKNSIVPPRVITIMQKCVELKIQDCMIQRLHYTDLYVLILSLDIANIKTALKRERQARAANSNTDVRDISGAEAVKFLQGGGSLAQ